MKRFIIFILILFLVGFAKGEVINTEPNCLVHWKCNDNAENITIADSTGNGFDFLEIGNTNTSVLHSSDGINGSFQMSRGGSYSVKGQITYGVTYPNYETLHNIFKNGVWSISVRFKTPAENTLSGIFEINYYGEVPYQLYMTSTGLVGISSGFNSHDVGDVEYDDNNWHLAVITRNISGAITVYIDGVLNCSINTSLPFPDAVPGNDIEVYFGSSDVVDGVGTPAILNGLIDDVRIYNREITVTERAFLYANGNGTEALYGNWFTVTTNNFNRLVAVERLNNTRLN